ncbi:MAG: hypothetical protein KZQ73_09440 [Candidatus Thiodiazotropha sp. (ex Semelilucina semeliformis)]|nr:hypothetical protein [Candidatus Thiodiazotropha sp. (ex Semelilucina semeliformis)]
MDDDHYIANEKNAHIDTSNFEKEILEDVNRNPDIKDEKFVEHIYNKVFSQTAVSPVEPDDEVLICRYLSPAKFIQFLDTREIAFPTANQFTDKRECEVPQDYNNAVLKILHTLDRSVSMWTNYVRDKSSTWNVSCWTELDNYFDDHLMWSIYAGGNQGIGITIRYSQLKEHLIDSVKDMDLDGQLQRGRVNYESISMLPFNKHYMFRNEKEVRFAFRSYNGKFTTVSVDGIFNLFGVRISPAAEPEHVDVIRNMWLKYDGEDRIQHPT